MHLAPKIVLTVEERMQLERLSRRRTTAVRVMQRAKIVLLAADGKLNREIAAELAINPNTVCRWRRRFAAERVAGILKDRPRVGAAQRKRAAAEARRIVKATTQEKPRAATHWSTRSLAKHLGVSDTKVQRVWKATQLKPHRVHTFKISNDPQFAEKVIDVVGLYINPPENALVLCADEKSQIQALERTQKSLPMYPGRGGTLTHDYKRHGTTTLFAAYNVMSGAVIGSCMPKHRHQEWLKFLKQIDRETPADKELHLVVDNYNTHKHAKVRNWLKRHKRFHMHFIPTSSSWLNIVERWFREITDKRIRRSNFRSVKDVVDAVMEFIQTHNQDAQPYLWKAKANEIIEKVKRARATLQKLQSE
jgi:transposase